MSIKTKLFSNIYICSLAFPQNVRKFLFIFGLRFVFAYYCFRQALQLIDILSYNKDTALFDNLSLFDTE